MAGGDYIAEETLYKGKPAIIGSVWRWLICLGTLGLGYIWFWLRDGHKEYLITNQRVVVEQGWFTRKIDTLELYRVEDIEMEKPFPQRLVKTGNITLITSDRLQPKLELLRLPVDVRQLYEKLRPCIQEAKLKFRSEVMGQ